MASQIIYSNEKEIVELQQYVFDTLWNKAIPAKIRISENQNKQTFGITEVLFVVIMLFIYQHKMQKLVLLMSEILQPPQ